MIPKIQKLFPTETKAGQELISTILSGNKFKLEHIQSFGEASPKDFWYDQDTEEWVALIAGSATIEFEPASLNLIAGDAILIKAHQKHRVTQTSEDAVWIAVHIEK